MKRKFILFAVVTLFAVVLLGSCKSSSHCPAYSQVEVEQAEENV